MAIYGLLAQSAQAEFYKSSEFLALSHNTQQSYISIAAGMAALIAAQNNKNQASCIDKWVSQHRSSGFKPVIETMKKYPDYHPMSVIAGILKKSCGSFKY